VGKVLVDPGSAVAVEQPTYLGALQAFAPYEAQFLPLQGDDEGPLPQALREASDARFAYLLPNFQNPSGRCIPLARREALVQAAASVGLPLVEDNPYGDLWYDEAPPPPLAAAAGDQAVYLGSFSKVLAPGLRLGYLVAPALLYPKLLQAKQAADLHTPSFNQRVVHEVVREGFLQQHVPTIRRRYRAQRDAMEAAMHRWLPAGCRWVRPSGGMFFWLTLPSGLDATALLAKAVDAGVAYVPGAAFYSADARADTLRLSFVTVDTARIEEGVRLLGGVLAQALERMPAQEIRA
jgi:2-aminoadipate transaminase